MGHGLSVATAKIDEILLPEEERRELEEIRENRKQAAAHAAYAAAAGVPSFAPVSMAERRRRAIERRQAGG